MKTYIILIWNKHNVSDKYWVIRKTKEEAIAVAKSYKDNDHCVEVYPYTWREPEDEKFFVI